MYKLKNFKNLGFILLVTSSISACNSGSTDSGNAPENVDTDPVTSVASINANDVSTVVYDNQVSSVSVMNAIASDNIDQTQLTSVISVNESNTGCELDDGSISTKDLSFEVNPSNAQSCLYQYQVTNTQTQEVSSAMVQMGVVASDATSLEVLQLEPISKVGQPTDNIDINIDTSDGSQLLSSNVTLIGSGTITVDEVNGVIRYTPTENGNYRIYYSLVNTEQTEVKAGHVDIAVTDTDNSGTEANNFRYVTTADAASDLTYTVIDADQEVTIDVSPYISDPDLDDVLTLSDVTAYNSITQIVSDHEFTFEAKTQGTYYVTYTVEDGKGSIAIGIVEIKVGSPWNDVLVSSISKQFLAPITYDAAVAARLSFSGIASESSVNGNGVSNVPTYSYDEANTICQAKGGFLPSKTELQAFADQEGNPYNPNDVAGIDEMAENWPVARAYFSHTEDDSNSDMVYAYDAVANSISLVNKSSYLYMMCVEGSSVSLLIDSNFYLTLNQVNDLSLAYSVNGEVVSNYTQPTLWQQGSLNDSSNTPELSSSDVVINDNQIVPTAEGWINITASSQVDTLSANRDYRVTSNILNVEGADPTFDSDILGSGTCQETLVNSSDNLSSGFIATDSGDIANVSNCTDSYNNTATNSFYKLSPLDGGVGTRLNLDSAKRVSLGKGNYTLSVWTKFEINGSTAAAKQVTLEASLYQESDTDDTKTCSIDNVGNVGGTNAAITSTSNGWSKVSCDISITDSDVYSFRLLARDNYTNSQTGTVYLDEPELLPKR